MKRNIALVSAVPLRQCLAACVVSLSLIAAVSANPIPGLYNTGVDPGGANLPGLADDPHYNIAFAPPSGLPIPDMVVPEDGFPGPCCWMANGVGSQFIGPLDLTAGNDANGDPGDFLYETTFDMTGLDPTNAFVGGAWATDDSGPNVLLNFIPAPNPVVNGFGGLTRFGISPVNGVFAPGVNGMIFQVSNGGGPTGLRVDQIYGRAAPLGTVKIPGLYNTGVNAVGLPLPDNALDPHYTAVAPGPVMPAFALPQDGYPIGGANPPGPWANNTGTSRWVSPPDADGNGPPVLYYYETKFDMTGLNPATAVITGLWSSDNTGVDILLNGVPTGNPQSGSFPNLNSPFEISAALGDVFLPGINTLTFLVDNLPPDFNPAGLRVEGIVAWARPVPEPSTGVMLTVGALLIAARRRRAR